MLMERAEAVNRICRISGYVITTAVYTGWAGSARTDTAGRAPLLMSAILLFLAWMAFGAAGKFAHRSPRSRHWHDAAGSAFYDALIALVCLAIVSILLPSPAIEISAPAASAAVVFLALTVLNRWLPEAVCWLILRTTNTYRILILGSSKAAAELRERLSAAEPLGIEFINGNRRPTGPALRLFHPEGRATAASSLTDAAAEHLLLAQQSDPIHEIAFICDNVDDATMEARRQIEQFCDEHGVRLSVYVNRFMTEHRPPARELHTTGIEQSQQEPLLNPLHVVVKRIVDIIVAVPFVAFVLPPLCLVVRIVQWIQSPGPLMYRQERCGKNGATFSIFKFRTMHVPQPGMTDLEDDPAPRIYRLGALLRDSRLDEFPQFINVLQGSMSVVGPRAHHAQDRRKFSERVRHYPLRFLAKPGITGLAQYREFLRVFDRDSIEARVRSDMEYIRSWSVWLDMSLIVRSGRVIPESIWRSVVRKLTSPEAQPARTISLQVHPAESESQKKAA